MRKLILILLISYLSRGPAAAFYRQSDANGGLPGEYLSFFTVSARAAGMGDAYTSLAGGASGSYYNPGGLVGLGHQQIEALYTPVLGQGNYGSLFYSRSLSLKTTVGFGIIGLYSGEAVKRNIWGEATGNFSENRTVITVNGAKKITPEFDAGISLKIVNHRIDEYSDSGLGADIGCKYTLSDRTRIGISLQNILAPAIRLKNKTDSFPMNIRTGVSSEFLVDRRLIFSLDAALFDPARQAAIRWAFGGEYNIYKISYIRAGINYKQITAGVGISTDIFDFSYAARYLSTGLMHTIGTSFKFGFLPSAREREISRREELLKEREKLFEKWTKNMQDDFSEQWKRSYTDLQVEYNKMTDKNKALESLIQAATSMKMGDYNNARKTIQEILKKNPENLNAKSMLRQIDEELKDSFSISKMMEYYNNNKYEDVLKEFKKADRTSHNYNEARTLALLASARISIITGKYGEAEGDLLEILELDKESTVAKTLLQKVRRLKEIKNEGF